MGKVIGKIVEALGVLVGAVLYYVWVFIFLVILHLFFAYKQVIHGTIVYTLPSNDVTAWLFGGPLAIYLMLGHYIFTRDPSDVGFLKSLSLGFGIWLGVLVILTLLGFSVSGNLRELFGFDYSISMYAIIFIGYLIMLTIFLKQYIAFLGGVKK